MNLREDKSWSYGVRNRLADAKGQRSILVNAPVQTDKTADSIKEIIKEFDYYLGDQLITKIIIKLFDDFFNGICCFISLNRCIN